MINFAKFSLKAIEPTQGTARVASFDLYSFKDVFSAPHSVQLVRNDIGFRMSLGYFGKIQIEIYGC